MNGKSVKLLFAQADKTVLAPILEALGAKGINVSEGSPEGDEILLAAFPEPLGSAPGERGWNPELARAARSGTCIL